MKLYRVKVNGKLYEVELESVKEVEGHVEAPVATEAPKAAPTTTTGGNEVLAPIAGKVVNIAVKVGDTVKKGQTVAIIEAMKLENEVPSAFDGTVKEIKVAQGANVQNQDVLVILG